MSGIKGSWAKALMEEVNKPYYKKLQEKVKEEYKTKEIFPPKEDIFNAFLYTPLEKVKVVILGQDPYHNTGQAHGLAFSVLPGVDIPPSLKNIFKEIQNEYNCPMPDSGCLTRWAEQGVFLLNPSSFEDTALTFS